jgi:hypothetical protein
MGSTVLSSAPGTAADCGGAAGFGAEHATAIDKAPATAAANPDFTISILIVELLS